MKKVIKVTKKKYGDGGQLPIDMMLSMASQLSAANAYTQEGAPNVGSMTASSALSGAGTGFALGNALMPGIGGAVGAVGGAVLGGIKGNKAAQKQAEEYALMERKKKAYETRLEDAERASFLKMYPSQGTEYNSLFAEGGDMFANGGNIMKIMGGNLKPVAPGVTKARGKKHKEGGIDILTAGGREVEIEDDEIVKDGRLVFSDRLKVPGTRRTYAQTAEYIAKTPAYIKNAQKTQKLENILGNPRNNQYKMGTAARTLERTINPLDRLFNMQEAQKSTMKVKTKGPVKAEYGIDMAEPEPFAANIRFLRDRFMNKYGPQLPALGQQFAGAATDALLPFGNQGNPATNGRSPLLGGAAPAIAAGFQMPNAMQKPMQTAITAGTVAQGIGDRMGTFPARADAMVRNSADALMPNTVKGPTSPDRVGPVANAAMERFLAQKGKVPGLVDKYGAKVMHGIGNYLSSPTQGEFAPEPPPAEERNFNLTNAMGKAAPYLDNLVNMMITNKTPKIPVPTYVDGPKLDTKFNIEPQKAEINRTAAARNRALESSTSNPQTLRANMLAGYAGDISARNALQGQKANVETDLRNKQSLIDYDTNKTNAGQYDDYQKMKMMRLDDIGRRQSMNAANLSEDMQFANQEKNLAIRDNQQLALVAMQYANSGVLDRTDMFAILQSIEDGKPFEKVLADLEAKKKKKGTTKPE